QKIRRNLPEPEQLRHFPRGIPDVLREALLGLHSGGFVQDHAAALVVYEVWHSAVIAAIWPPEQLLSIEMLVDHAATTARHSTEKTVRKGVMQLSALGFFAPGAVIHSRRGRPIQQYQARPLHLALPIFIEHVCRRLRERTFKDKVLDTVTADWFVGQPPAHAAVLARMENDHREQGYGTLAQEYERTEAAYQKTARALHFKLEFASLLTAPVLELTPDRTWEHGRAYRQAYYKVRALQRYQHHAAITRTRAAQQVGVSHKTLKVIQKRESIAVDPQFITLEVRQVEGLMDRLNRAAPWARRYHYGRFLENSRGQRITVHPDDTDEHLRAWVEEQFKAGEGVAARVQIAGKERPATAEEIQAFQKRLMPPRRAPVTISARELPPREELSPPHLSLKYRVMQLMMGGRKADEAYTLLGLSHFQPYLFPDFPYSSTVSGRGGGKKGNKSAAPPPGVDQPPDRSAPP
ncbi:MAG TPA: hypothetical protein VJZ27_18115, partial [Aggregatilineales bacterium]|nr:hypothetical protein [Aggregatilineales bacterium]